MDYGLQLYSVRDSAGRDLESTVAEVAKIGYKTVEFAGFFGRTADQVRRMCEQNGVALSGTHTAIDELLADYGGTVAFHRAIGNHFYIIPGADLSTRDKLDAFIAQVNELTPRLEDEGLALCYHNHDHEFRPNADGLVVFDELTQRTRLGLELDTFWAYAAGRDPVELMERWRDRLRFVHIKDGFADGNGMPLGRGTAPVRAVYRKAIALGVALIVESETLSPDGLTEARLCFDELKRLEQGR